MNITSVLKDSILTLLLSKYPIGHCQIDIEDIYKEFSIDFDTINIILKDFQQRGFIDDLNARRVAVFLSLNYGMASDFLSSGGFQGAENSTELVKKLLLLEIEKLQLEIKELTKKHPMVPVERITSIVGNIASTLSLFLGK